MAKFDCATCTDLEKMARGCGLESYKGEKLPNVMFKINFGKKLIKECPNSYVDWTNVGDALQAYQFYESGYLPEVYDENTNRPLSILDQTEFFTKAHQVVSKVKNKAEQQAMEASQNSSKSKTPINSKK